MAEESNADTASMAELVEKRWTRYGKDRVYVSTRDGVGVGYVDLKARTIVVEDPHFQQALSEAMARWCPVDDQAGLGTGLSGAEAEVATPEPASFAQTSPWAPPPPPQEAPVNDPQPRPEVGTTSDPWSQPSEGGVTGADARPGSPDSPGRHDAQAGTDATPEEPRDLVQNVAGAAARAKRNEVNAEAPVLNLVARVLGVKTDERNWRVGAKGEEKVAGQLAKLGDGWHRIHAVPVGENGSDIDHVVIGPPGVFTLNAKRHPRGKAWVGEHAVLVNGHKTNYLRNSRFEAKRASKLLSDVCGFQVPVTSVVVFVDLETYTVKQMPPDVQVTTRLRLLKWFRSLPPTLDADTVESIFAAARRSTTWQPPTG